jgi:ribokinase
MKVAVVGHVEWATFAVVDRVPTPGEIVHALEWFELPAGGGAVAAVQLANLAGSCRFYTALGDDGLGHRAEGELSDLGVTVRAVYRPAPQRRVFVYLDRAGERTITTIGERHGPTPEDPLPWEELAQVDAVYYTAGGAEAVRAARRARTLVATSRDVRPLVEAAVRLDAVVGSGRDAGERYPEGALQPPPALIVRTSGPDGGTYETDTGELGAWDPAPLPGTPVDAYGCGDSFAAGLAFALGRRDALDDALALAARCGAACLTGRGPYEAQLSLP